MNRTLSYKLARMIKNADPERTHSIEVMQYALTILLNTFFIFVVVLAIGWVTGTFVSTAITLGSFTLLRMVSGGVHLKKAWECNVVSIFICTVIPHLPLLPMPYFIGFNLCSLLIMLLYAPAPDRNARLPRKLYPYLKGISIALVLSNFFIVSHIFVYICLIQSLTLLPLRKEVRSK